MRKITTDYSLFEAFESQVLGKTLNFVENSSRNRFMETLRELCSTLDFPISDLSDDMFQYLPFKKALFLNTKSEDSPCDATSQRAFPEYAVEREVCNGGMIKRKWGRSVRVVSCPICGGTGVKPKGSGEIKWLKFWFDKDGKYVAATVTDGLIRPQSSTMRSTSLRFKSPSVPADRFSTDLSDYQEIDEIRGYEAVKDLPHGTIVKINLSTGYVVGMIWQSDSGRTYVLQDRDSGNEDGSNPDWRSHARYSWIMSDDGCLRDRRVYILVPKGTVVTKKEETEESAEEKVNPYTWNTTFYISGKSIKPERNSAMDELLKNSHFALVMDYKVFVVKEFKSVSKTKGERVESRTGASKLKSDDEVRAENIKKYISQIADRVVVSEDFKDLPKSIVRLFGWNNAAIYVLKGRNFNTFNNIIINLFESIKATDERTKGVYLENIKDYIKNSLRSNMDYNDEVTRGFHRAYQHFQNEERYKDYIKLLDAYYEINKEIIALINRSEIECIEDLDALYAKLASVRRTYSESDRFQSMRSMDYFFSNISRENCYEYLKQYLSLTGVERTVETMKRFAKMVSKL